MAKFSQRSKDALVGLDPRLVRVLEAAIIDTPVDFTINEGVRTTKLQGMYYTWGRTVVNPNTGPLAGRPFGAIVTKRDGVKLKSEHQVKASGYGEAVDIVPFSRDKYGKGFLDWNNDKAYGKLAAHILGKAKELGVPMRWGGDWNRNGKTRAQGDTAENLVDLPHFEII